MPKHNIPVSDAIVNDPKTDTNLASSTFHPMAVVQWTSLGQQHDARLDPHAPHVAVAFEAHVEGEVDPRYPRAVYLSRDEINRMIRALRDARDSAYGRDQ